MGLLKGFFGLCGRKEPFHIGGKNGLVFNALITYRPSLDHDTRCKHGFNNNVCACAHNKCMHCGYLLIKKYRT